MNKILPDPKGLLEQAELADMGGAIMPRHGIGKQYIDACVVLRSKNWTFPAITKWMEEHGVTLSVHGWRSAYDVYRGAKTHTKKK